MSMPIQDNADEVCQRGEEMYEKDIRFKVETEGNIGKLISIDIQSGDYEIADNLIDASHLIKKRHPDAVIYGARIGYDSAYALGTEIERIKR